MYKIIYPGKKKDRQHDKKKKIMKNGVGVIVDEETRGGLEEKW